MKIKIITITALLIQTVVFSQIRQFKNLKQLPKKAIKKEIVLNEGINLTLNNPADKSVVQNLSPTFKWTINNPRPARKNIKYTITILDIDGSNSLAQAISNNRIVFQKTFSKIDFGNLSQKFNNLQLENNNAYIWNISIQQNNKPTSSNWHRFIVTTHDISDSDIKDIHACESKNLTLENSFMSQRSWRVHQGNPRLETSSMGHDDNGYSSLSYINGSSDVITQSLGSNLIQNKNYTFKFSFKMPKNIGNSARLKVIAYNGTLTSLESSSNSKIIGITGNLPSSTDWSKTELPVWTASSNFSNIAVVVFSGDASSSDVKRTNFTIFLDRFCLSETTKSPCDESNEVVLTDGEYVLPEEFQNYIEENSIEPIKTTFDYNNGSVRDLYPNADLSSTDWVMELENGNNPCFSVGGEFPEAEVNSVLNQYNQNELDDLNEEIKDFEDNYQDNQPATSSLRPIVYIHNEKCAGTPTIDPSKPFGGRDVVYIHGLQLAALIGNLEPTPTFQGKWPQNPEEFYIGGEFYEEASGRYWDKHIKRGLGSLTSPTNSYLKVTYSANQRLQYGVHAVLTQINDALKGTNKGVVWGRGKNKECFGKNGIVLVTHSTGGLIASTMLGIAEATKNPNSQERQVYGEAYKIVERIKGQIGINAAYAGSPLASIAIEASIAGANSHITDNSIKGRILRQWFNSRTNTIIDDLPRISNILQNGILVDLMPQVSRNWARKYYGLTKKPTLTVSGGFPALAQGSGLTWAGKFLIKSFDDGVLSVSSQSGSMHKEPLFRAKNSLLLIDMGVPLSMKRTGLGMERRDGLISDNKHFPVVPIYSQTGMVQSSSIRSVSTPPQNWPNHYAVIQNTGDHFDNVNEVERNGNNYEQSITGNVNNNEETSVIFDNRVYSIGALSTHFQNLTNEHVRKETWGLHLPRCKFSWTWAGWRPVIKINCYWFYKEFLIWKRTYHLLEGYQTKLGMDYMYDHAFKN
jgi:hypothetical protein